MRRESFEVAVGCLSFANHLLRVQNWEQDAKGVISIISIVFVSVDCEISSRAFICNPDHHHGFSSVFFARVYLQSRSSPWFFFGLLCARSFAIAIISMVFLRSSSSAFICNHHHYHRFSRSFACSVPSWKVFLALGFQIVAFLRGIWLPMAPEPALAFLGPQIIAFLLRFSLAMAPEPAPGHLGPQMVAFLLRLSLARAPEPGTGHLGPQMVAFLLRLL